MPKNDGIGHYYRDGKKIEITWGDKISKSLSDPDIQAKRMRKRKCVVCKEQFTGQSHQKYCSNKCRRNRYKDHPLDRKVRSLGANILSSATPGEKKVDFIREMIVEAVDSPCKYCGEKLTLETLSLDHKEPIRKNSIRRNKKTKESREMRMKLDQKDNLHIICGKCNSMKSDISHKNWLLFIKFLEDKPQMKDSIFNRLSVSRMMFRRK